VIDVLIQARQGHSTFARPVQVGVLGVKLSIRLFLTSMCPCFAQDGESLVAWGYHHLGNTPLHILSVNGTDRATLSITDDDLINYVHGGSLEPTDFFTILVTNNYGGSAVGRVYVDVRPADLIVTTTSEYGSGSIREMLDFVANNPRWMDGPLR